MKHLLVGLTLVVGISCQIYTKLQADGYHYDKPVSRLDIPEAKPECPNGGSGKFCCVNGADNEDCAIPTLPPLPPFIPVINLPKVIPVNPKPRVEAQDEAIRPPLPVKPDPTTVEPEVFTYPPATQPPVPFIPAAVPESRVSEPEPKVKPVKPDVCSPERIRALEAKLAALNNEKSPNEYLPPKHDYDAEWEAWKAKYNKVYDSPAEEYCRKLHFTDNSIDIHANNDDFAAGKGSFEMDQNKFCDMPQDEFEFLNTGLKNRVKRSTSGEPRIQGKNVMNFFMPSPMLEAEVEDSFDWREKGAITPVKNQGKCASCWAFAANGALEAHNFLRKNTGPVALSEQNLIDCVKDNDGCDGGYMTNAFHYVKKNFGVDTESSYPYEAVDNKKCRFDASNVGGEAMDHMEIQVGNEEALKQAVATIGPVAAGIDGGLRSFQFYKSGYYFEPKCGTTEDDVNHAIVVVGYGKTEKGEEYWIGKNSWDTDWGEEGYIRMARNKNNHCGITSLASYPIV